MTLEYVTPDALKVIEAAGRTCYKSENKITDVSAIEFLKLILSYEHESVLEHASARFRIITDRGVSHEIVRHRLASYSQESTRYCNYSKDKFGHEITVIYPVWYDTVDENSLKIYKIIEQPEKIRMRDEIWTKACEASEKYYFELLNAGATAQEARAVLPNSLKTELVMTANLREWKHFFELRTTPKAHPQMRELAIQGLKQLREQVPIIFDNIPLEL